jgi:hypothetical protein
MYEIIRGFFSERKTVFFAIAVCVVVFLAGVCAGYFCGIRNAGKTDTGNVPNNGTGIDDIREQYHQIEVDQHQLTDGIKQATGTAESIAESSAAIAGTAGNIAGGVREAGAILDECQQLIGTIRNRRQTGTAAN